MDNFPNAKLAAIEPKYYLRFSDTGDIAIAKANASSFINALNKLYMEVKFNHFLKKHQSYYHIAVSEVRKGLPGGTFLPAMERFYGIKFDSYHLMPSLTLPPTMGFGVSYRKAGKITVNSVFSPFGFQEINEGKPIDLAFNDKAKIRELSTHEFGHSFVNPVIDSIPQTLIEGTQALFDTVKEAMSNQGYSQWKICLYEHFVRAGEVIIARNLVYPGEAENLLKEYVETRRFIYLPLIIKVLEGYNKTPGSSYKNYVIEALAEMKEAYSERVTNQTQK